MIEIRMFLFLYFVMFADGGLDPRYIQRHIYTLEDFCDILPRTVHFSEQLIVRSQMHGKIAYKTNVTCAMDINGTDNSDGFVIAMRTVSTSGPDDNLTIIMKNESIHTLYGNLYTNESTENVYYTKKDGIRIIWQTAPRENQSLVEGFGFEMTITPFVKDCHDVQKCFDCGSDRSIHRHFACNDRNNCGNLSDELSCDEHKEKTNFFLIACGYGFACCSLCLITLVVSKRFAKMPRTRFSEPLITDDVGEDGERTPFMSPSPEPGGTRNVKCLDIVTLFKRTVSWEKGRDFADRDVSMTNPDNSGMISSSDTEAFGGNTKQDTT